jgi:hypothetical protein
MVVVLEVRGKGVLAGMLELGRSAAVAEAGDFMAVAEAHPLVAQG